MEQLDLLYASALGNPVAGPAEGTSSVMLAQDTFLEY
jgi:hypothetical protein